MAACASAKTPRSRSRILPPPRSSAGVPTTLTVRPMSSATRAAAVPAPTAMAAIRLCPQAWPMPGRQSYSAHRARWSGPEPPRATNAVGRPPTPRSTAKPAASRASAHHAAARSSSKASSGWAWMRWLSATRRSRLAAIRSRTAALASMGTSGSSCRKAAPSVKGGGEAHSLSSAYHGIQAFGRLASRRGEGANAVPRRADRRRGRARRSRADLRPAGRGGGAGRGRGAGDRWAGMERQALPRPLLAASGAGGVHRPPRPRAEGAAPRALDRALRRARPGARARLLCVAARLAVVEGPLTPVARAAGGVMVMDARAAADATLGGVEGGGAARRAAGGPGPPTAPVAPPLGGKAHPGLLARPLLV